MLSKYEKYRLIYSPRTSISHMREREEKLFNDLGIGFEPSTIEIMKKHFKERLGVLNKVTFISIIKRHLNKWHPNLYNREEILVKLLSRLFDQIDLNSNGDMEWNEFMNYIVDSSFQKNFQKASNTLQHYAICKTSFALSSVPGGDEVDRSNLLSNFNQSVAYCFYILKYKLVGVVHENKSNIIFYNAETNKKEGREINLMESQNEIDQFEINELDHKTKIMLQKESEKARQLFLKQKENILSFRKKNNIKGSISMNRKNFLHKETFRSKEKEKERVPTPLAISREIRLIKGNNFLNNQKRNINRKLSTLCTYFLEEYDLLFISSSNNKISAWRYDVEIKGFKNVNSSNYQLKNFVFSAKEMKIPIFSSEIPQYTLCFDSLMNKLYSGQEDGKILVWNMNSSKCKDYLYLNESQNNFIKTQGNKTKTITFENNESINLKSDRRRKSNEEFNSNINSNESEIEAMETRNKQFLNGYNKSDTVSCLLILNKLRLLCSSYYNGKIILWDVATKKPKKIFNEQKTGIYHFVYDPYKNYLYTCGFDHNIYVYDPYNEDSSIYQLKGHNSSVKSLSLNLENNELISIDINGNLKIWDTTIFMNFQTLNIYNSLIAEQGHSKKQAEQLVNKKKIMSNIHVLSLSNIKKILVFGDKFLVYEKGKTKNPDLCDDNLILGCIYNNFQNDLITFAHFRVKLWDIFTGKVKIIFEDPMDGGEITSFANDIQMKRFYIGDNLGKIKNFNLSTGGYLKSFIPHKAEIIHLIHSSEFELLITCSSDLVIRFQNDSELTTTEIIKEINLNYLFSSSLVDHIYLKDVKLNEEDGHLMMGLSNTWISFYDIKHYKYLNLINNPQEAISKATSISCIEDIKNFHILFIAYENAKKFFILKPNNKFYNLLSFKKFGNFIENDCELYINKDNYKNDDYRGIVVSCLYDSSTNKLITGDHLGFINIYDLNIFNDFMNKNFENEEEIMNYAFNEINVNNILYIKAHKESIKHLSIPQDLKPEIILSTSNDRTVKLFNYQTGEYIDSLKQASIKYSPIPIAIEYIKNNPFLEDVDEIEQKSKMELYDTESVLKFNEIKNNKHTPKVEENLNDSEKKSTYPIPKVDTIFRENVIRKNIRPPEFDIDNVLNSNAFGVSNDILEYNAKVKLHDTSLGTNIPSNRSTLWNYDIDINFILNKNKEDIQELIDQINTKENEIVQTELAYKNISIYNPKYNPIFLRNLDDDEKSELTEIINDKIKNIKFAISRSQISKCENEAIKKIYHFTSPKDNEEREALTYDPVKRKFVSQNKSKSKTNIKTKFSLTTNGFGKKTIYKKRSLDKEKILPKMKTMGNTGENFKSKLKTARNNFDINNIQINPMKTTVGNENNKFHRKFNDHRIQRCLNQFEEKLTELARPFAMLYHNKKIKKNALPKINYNIFTGYNIDK